MAIVKQGSTTLNAGSKGDKGEQGDAGVVQSISAGANVTVDSSDPANPIVSSSGGGGSSNPNIIVVTSLAELLAVTGTNKIIDIQEPITLLANYVVPSDSTLYFSSGQIILNGFNITGDNTSFEGLTTKQVYFQLDEVSQLDGVWNPPTELTTKMFGVREDGLLKMGSGNISAGATTFTDATATYTSNDVGKTITVIDAGVNANVGQSINYVLSSTIASVTNATTIELADAADNTTSSTNYIYGSDDFNLVDQALRMMNQINGSNLTIGSSGKTMTTKSVFVAAGITYRPSGWCIGDKTNGHNVYIQGDIQLFSHDLEKSHLLSTWYTRNSHIIGTGGRFLGDYKTPLGVHIYTNQNGKSENNHCIVKHSMSVNCTENGLNIFGFYGDGIYGTGDSQFMNQIDGVNKIDAATDSLISVGYIDEFGVVDAANTDFVYSTSFLTLEGGQFDNITSVGVQRFMMLTGSSFGSWGGSANPYFWVLYYDTNDNFLFKTQPLTWFSRVYIPEESYVKCKILLMNPDNFGGVTDDIEINLRPSLHSFGGGLYNSKIMFCGREAYSNGGSDYEIDNNILANIGGLPAGPGYAINWEDGGRIKQNLRITNNRIFNCWGGISIKNAENVFISGNVIGAETLDLSAAPTNEWQAGITTNGYNVEVYNNTLYNCGTGISRRTRMFENKFIFGRVDYEGTGESIEQNLFRNIALYENTSNARVGNPSVFKNNVFRYDLDNSSYYFKESFNAASFIDNEFVFNNVSEWKNDTQSSSNNMITNSVKLGLTVNRLFLRQTQTLDIGGVFTGNTVTGMLPSVSSRDFSSGNGWFRLGTTNCRIDMPVEFNYGFPVDYTRENLIVNSWVEEDLNQYESTIISPTPLITYIDSEFNLLEADGYPMANNGFALWSTAEKNVSYYLKNHKFKIEQAFAYNYIASQKLFDINHLGTTVLENCLFDMQGNPNYVMDMRQGINFGDNLGAVTFIDPILKNGMSITLRKVANADAVDDFVVFTKPSALMSTYAQYADEATADLAGYPSGYLYVTPTGEMRMKL